MTLSTIQPSARSAAPPAFACREAPPLVEFTAPLPARLGRFGRRVRASLHGADGAPVVVVLGGISADRFPCLRPDGSAGWWRGLAGPGAAADPAHYRILGIDFIADEAGLAAPSTRDQAEAVCAALDAAGVAQARAIVGASYGGMTALALGEHFPARAERIAVVCAAEAPHPAATAVRELNT